MIRYVAIVSFFFSFNLFYNIYVLIVVPCVLKGTLDRDKVRKMCEILFHDVDPNLGVVSEQDVDEVMMIGEMNSHSPDHHITVEEIPKALSTIMAIKKNKQHIHDLFKKHKVAGSQPLSSLDLSALLSELNDGILPNPDDLNFIVRKCGGPDVMVDLAHLTSAIEIWYVLVAQGPLPDSVDAAKAAGYTDEQIATFQNTPPPIVTPRETPPEVAIETVSDVIATPESPEIPQTEVSE